MLKQSIVNARLCYQLCGIQTRSYAPRGHRDDIANKKAQRNVMPGIRRQVELLNDFDELMDDPEGVGNYEADFNELSKVHQDFEREVVFNDNKIKQIMIKNKYFKENQRNFLTWAEKEQIRNLHNDNPDEWPFERLAESFPITIENVAKVAKAKWIPKNAKRVQKHDEAVKNTWELFRKNELNDLDLDFVAHLRKFSHRDFDNSEMNVNFQAMQKHKFVFPKPKRTEFASIITSCQPAKIEANDQEKVAISDGREVSNVPAHISKMLKLNKFEQTAGGDDSFLLQPVFERKHYQFDGISRSKAIQKIKKVEPEPVSMNPFQKADGDEEIITLKTVDFVEPIKSIKNVAKYETRTSTVDTYERVNPMDAVDVVRQRLPIPRQLYRRGATYQFRDCFYDSTGEFLYRVPGMIAK